MSGLEHVLIAQGYDAHIMGLTCRHEFAVVTGTIRQFDLQFLLAGDADNVFPVDTDRSHRVGRIAQGAEFEAFDLSCDGVAIFQDNDVVLLGCGRNRRESEQQKGRQYGAKSLSGH